MSGQRVFVTNGGAASAKGQRVYVTNALDPGDGDIGQFLAAGDPPTWSDLPAHGAAELTREMLDFSSTMIPEPVGGTLTLAVGSIHTSTCAATLATIVFSGDPDTAKPATILRLNVTNGPVKINIPTCYRLGPTNNSISSIILNNGRHELSWVYAEGAYWMADSVTADQLVLIPSDLSGDTVASASTLNLTTTYDKQLDVTGTTTINAITIDEGDQRLLVFKGVTTLTQGASLLLPGGSNITTSVDSWAVVQGGAAGVVTLLHYEDAPGFKKITVHDIYMLGAANITFAEGESNFTIGRSLDNPTLGNYLYIANGISGVGIVNASSGNSVQLKSDLLTAGRDQSFPDKSGTFAMLDDLSGFAATALLEQTVRFEDGNTALSDVSTSSVDGTEDILYSSSAAGLQVSSRQTMSVAGHATATRRIKSYYNGVLIWDSGSLTLPLGGTFILEIRVYHVSSHVYKASVSVSARSASTVPFAVYTSMSDGDFTESALKTTGIAAGAGAASGDITMNCVKTGSESQ